MNWMPSNLGAEPKKIAILVVTAVVGVGVYLYNRNPSEGPASAPQIISRAPVTTSYGAARPERPSFRVVQNAGSGTREFKPSLKIKEIEPSSIDPTLHLDLLAKLKTVSVDPSSRSLFEIGAAPAAEILKEPAKIAIVRPFMGPQPLPPVVVPPDPKAPPIPLKFYGFVNKSKVGEMTS